MTKEGGYIAGQFHSIMCDMVFMQTTQGLDFSPGHEGMSWLLWRSAFKFCWVAL